ncbi:hypothetical protein BC830DRAFT_159980 [Chytriomyces sp. MP71]|nr:hypothetical protein BC830DRAFT_159980 [Chytriomyces sp. MP71]
MNRCSLFSRRAEAESGAKNKALVLDTLFSTQSDCEWREEGWGLARGIRLCTNTHVHDAAYMRGAGRPVLPLSIAPPLSTDQSSLPKPHEKQPRPQCMQHAQKRVYTVPGPTKPSAPPPGIVGSDPSSLNGSQPALLPPPPPPHTVKATLSVVYSLERKEKEVLAPLPRALVGKKAGGAAMAPAKAAIPRTNNEEKRSFYLQYSLGPNVVDAKSGTFSQVETIVYMNPLEPSQPIHPRPPPPPPVEWSATHDIEVTLDTLTAHFLGKPLVLGVYEVLRVEVEKKTGLTREMLDMLALAAGTKGLEATVADVGLTGKQHAARMRKMREKEKEAQAAAVAAVEAQQATLMAFAEKGKGFGAGVGAGVGEGANYVSFLTKRRVRAASDAPEGVHPHHYDHPEKHMRPLNAGGVVGGLPVIRRTRSTQSLANLAALRPKTPPSPHHHEGPLATLREAALRQRSLSNARHSVGVAPKGVGPPDLSALRFIGGSVTPMRPESSKSSMGGGAAASTYFPASRASTPRLPRPRPGSLNDLTGPHHTTKSDTTKSISTLSQEAVNAVSQKSLTNLTKALLDPDTLSQISGTTAGGKTKKVSKMGKEKVEKPEKKRKFVFETRKVLVGRMFLDLTNLICGETKIEGVLENPIPGFTQLTSQLQLAIPLLSPQLLQYVKPISISLLCAQNLPNAPKSFRALDETCLPLRSARFQFFNDGSYRVYESLLTGPHGATAMFGTRHVILAGLLDAQTLAENVARDDALVVKLFDRIPKPRSDIGDDNEEEDVDEQDGVVARFGGDEERMGPWGEARFSLKEFLEGEGDKRCVRMRAPILPGKRKSIPSEVPAGLWVESGATFVAEFEAWCKIVDVCSVEEESIEGNLFGRVIIFSSAENETIRNCLDTIISGVNAVSDATLELSHLTSPESTLTTSVTDPKLGQRDYLSGFIVTTQTVQVHILEGLKGGAISQLKRELKVMQANNTTGSKNVFQFDPDCGFESRIWDTIDAVDGEERIVRFKLHRDLDEIISWPRIYIKDAIPERAYKCLMWLSKLKGMHFLIENTSTKAPYFASRKAMLSLAHTFGVIQRSHARPSTSRSSLLSTMGSTKPVWRQAKGKRQVAPHNNKLVADSKSRSIATVN